MVRNILKVTQVHKHSGDECFPQQFSLGGILEGYPNCTPGGIRGKQGFNDEQLDVRDAIRSTPGASGSHLGGRTGRDEYVTCMGKGQTKSNWERKTLV